MSGIVPRLASHPGAKQIHLKKITFSSQICPCEGSKPKPSPEAAMGGRAGPFNVALQSVTTERVGVLSQTPTDPRKFFSRYQGLVVPANGPVKYFY